MKIYAAAGDDVGHCVMRVAVVFAKEMTHALRKLRCLRLIDPGGQHALGRRKIENFRSRLHGAKQGLTKRPYFAVATADRHFHYVLVELDIVGADKISGLVKTRKDRDGVVG